MNNKIQKIVSKITLSAIVLSMLTSCASIVSKSDWPVNINTDPGGATVVITNSKGRKVFSGVTPTTVMLSSKKAYFQGESYALEFSKDGYSAKSYQLNASMNGWYIGNIVFGGLIGLLIVDPLTGAMYKFGKEVTINLISDVSLISDESELRIVSMDKIPLKLRDDLVEIKI